MRTSRVVVLPYDSAWRDAFLKIRNEILAAVGDYALAVEHVGSTSVEGLCAKPCIDIDLVIADYTDFEAVVHGLSGIGYYREGDLGISGREAFGYTDKPHLMAHHLYVCTRDSSELKRHLTFRDYLRENPSALRRYGEVKMRAAQLFPDDIDGYIEYKSRCIIQLYRECGLE